MNRLKPTKSAMVLTFFIFTLLVSCKTPTQSPITETATSPTSTPISVSPFVKVDGLGFSYQGQPFRFVGANSIYLAYYKEYGYDMEAAIKSAKENNINVLRIYLGFGEDTWGQKPIEEYDKVLDLASKNDILIIAVLTDCCCFGGDWSKDEQSYYSHVPYCDFRSSSSLASYQNYLDTLLLRKNTINGKVYKDDPTIMAWDVANEPTCQFATTDEIKTWLTNVTAYIKSVDTNHLVTFGIDDGNPTFDTEGPSYDMLNVPDLDFFSIHYYTRQDISSSANLLNLQFRVNQFLSMGKPVILEEFGLHSLRYFNPPLNSTKMAQYVAGFKNQMDIVFSAGGSGAMFWGWGVPETVKVPLWWSLEDHDTTETAVTTMLRAYQFPTPGSFIVTPEPPPAPDDTFDGTKIDDTKWLIQTGDGSSATQDGKLILSTTDATATSGATAYAKWFLSGDFDIQVDFEIGPGWKSPSQDHLDGANMGVRIDGVEYHITRLRSINQDGFYAWNGVDTLSGEAPSTATSGKYRLVRKGTELTLYYDIGNGWQKTDQLIVPASLARVYFRIASVNASQTFSTTFDNFKVNTGEITTQP
jgi:hypothetical protein